MSSLKEIKSRIASINSTQKITAAMKMVSSAKLHRAQAATEHTLAYSQQLSEIFNSLLSNNNDIDSPLMAKREVKSVALVVFSANSGLCGVFNANVWKALNEQLKEYEAKQIRPVIYPVGKSVAKELDKAGYDYCHDFIGATDNLSFETALTLANRLQELFLSKEVDQVVLLYHHFKNMAQQIITKQTYLPISLEGQTTQSTEGYVSDYILEPSTDELLEVLFPKMLNLQIYTVMLDTTTAEHAARMMAMQTANDNANDLIQELTLQYNKTRQQAITNELLDIMGGSQK